MGKKIRKYGQEFLLRAQAAVWATASQVALRGHVPLFPGLDVGYDLVLDNGLRLQVKSATLRRNAIANYLEGCYVFNLRRGAWNSKTKSYTHDAKDYRPYSEVADFYVLWGIDENRFFIVPTSHAGKTVSFGPRGYVSKSKNRSLYDKITGQRLAAMEDRWDLLDVNSLSNTLIDSVSTELQQAQKEN